MSDIGHSPNHSERQDEKAVQEARIEKVHHAVRVVGIPVRGPVTQEVVDTLRNDPDLAEVAEVAEEYV